MSKRADGRRCQVIRYQAAKFIKVKDDWGPERLGKKLAKKPSEKVVAEGRRDGADNRRSTKKPIPNVFGGAAQRNYS